MRILKYKLSFLVPAVFFLNTWEKLLLYLKNSPLAIKSIIVMSSMIDLALVSQGKILCRSLLGIEELRKINLVSRNWKKEDMSERVLISPNLL